MEELMNIIKILFTTIGGFLGYVLGGGDSFLYALIMFVIVDYITGVMVAIIEKTLSSRIGFKGIFKKVLIFFMVGIAHVIDINILESSHFLRTAVIFFYISNEGISILENTSIIGLPIPSKLKEVLEKLKSYEGDK